VAAIGMIPLSKYESKHLAEHLSGAGLVAELHHLLARNSEGNLNWWYCEKQSLGDIDGYIADVALAWTHSESSQRSDGKQASPFDGISGQIRYALITSSINSQVEDMPPKFIRCLVKEDIWSSAYALKWIQRIPREDDRATSLAGIAEYLSPSTVRQAFATAMELETDFAWFQGISGLAPYLSAEMLEEAVEAALLRRSKQASGATLCRLAPYVSRSLRMQTAAIAFERVLPIERLDAFRTSLLVSVIPAFPRSERLKAWKAILDSIATIQNEEGRYQAIAIASAFLPTKLIPAVIRIAADHDGVRVLAASALAPRLSVSQLKRELTLGRRFRFGVANTTAYGTLLQALVRKGATAYATDLSVLSSNPKVLTGVAGVLRGKHRARVSRRRAQVIRDTIARARKESVPYSRLTLLLEIVPYLRGTQRRNVLRDAVTAARKAVKIAGNQIFSVKALADLLPMLSGYKKLELSRETIDATMALPSAGDRREAVDLIAPYLSKDCLNTVLSNLSRSDQYQQAITVLRIAHTRQQPPSDTDVAWLVSRMNLVREDSERTHLLEQIAPYLSPPHLRIAMIAARELEDDEERFRALAALAPTVFRTRGTSKGLELARSIDDAEYRSLALARISSQVNSPRRTLIQQEAVAEAKNIQLDVDRAITMAKLMHHVEDEFLTQDVWRQVKLAGKGALEGTSNVRWPEELIKLAGIVSKPLQDEIVGEALIAAKALSQLSHRARLLTALLPFLSAEVRNDIVAQSWTDAVQSDSSDDYTVTIRSIEQNHKRDEIDYVEEDREDLWLLNMEVLREHRATLDIRGEALAPLMAYVSPELQHHAVSIVEGIADEYRRLVALAAIQPGLSEPLRSETYQRLIRDALRLLRNVDRATALAAIIVGQQNNLQNVPPVLLHTMLRGFGSAGRVQLLTTLRDLVDLKAFFNDMEIDSLIVAIKDVARWWS
jgi:hypothetical protein